MERADWHKKQNKRHTHTADPLASSATFFLPTEHYQVAHISTRFCQLTVRLSELYKTRRQIHKRRSIDGHLSAMVKCKSIEYSYTQKKNKQIRDEKMWMVIGRCRNEHLVEMLMDLQTAMTYAAQPTENSSLTHSFVCTVETDLRLSRLPLRLPARGKHNRRRYLRRLRTKSVVDSVEFNHLTLIVLMWRIG